MSTSYIPAEDSGALLWMKTFSDRLALMPSTYAVSGPDCENIAYVVGQFETAYLVANNPATRSPTSVNIKNVCRATAEQVCRNYAIQIKYNAGITDADKIAAGVRPVTHERTPILAPDSSPLLNIIGATPGAQTIRYADSFTPDSGKRPFGASNLQLFLHVADTATDNPDLAAYQGAYTRNPIGVAFDPEQDGKMATYFARWMTAKGLVGPWSLGVSMRIAA